jgi:hypothetical protein
MGILRIDSCPRIAPDNRSRPTGAATRPDPSPQTAAASRSRLEPPEAYFGIPASTTE